MDVLVAGLDLRRKAHGALAVSFIRLVIARAFMMAYCRVTRGLWLPTDADAHTWLLLGASGFFGFFLCDLCLFKSMLLIGPRLTLLLFSLSPPIAAIISWVCINDELRCGIGWRWRLRWRASFGSSWNNPVATSRRCARGHWGRGVVLGIFAAIPAPSDLSSPKRESATYDPVAATLIRALVALPGYFVLITLWRRWPAMLAGARHFRAVAILTFGAVVGPFIGVSLNMVALRYAPTGIVATIIATMPVLILPFSILLYHEKVSLRAVGGAIVAVVGVAMLMLLQMRFTKLCKC